MQRSHLSISRLETSVHALNECIKPVRGVRVADPSRSLYRQVRRERLTHARINEMHFLPCTLSLLKQRFNYVLFAGIRTLGLMHDGVSVYHYTAVEHKLCYILT